MIALIAPLSARAQLVSALEAGATSRSYAGGADARLLSVSPSLEWLRPRTRLFASGGVATRDDGRVATTGALRGSWFTPPVGVGRLELGSQATWDDVDPNGRDGGLLGEARVHLSGVSRGVWLGAGAGRAVEAADRFAVRAMSAGAWARFGSATLRVSVSSARASGIDPPRSGSRRNPPEDSLAASVSSALAPQVVTVDTPRVAGVANRTDTEASLRWRLGVFALELLAGTSLRTSAGPTMWGSARAMLWLSNRVAIVGSGGSQPPSLMFGRPATRHATLALHFERRRAEEPDPHPIPPPPRAAGGAASALDVSDAGGGLRRIRLRVPSARTVELMADFTGWEPVALARTDDGAWTIALPIAPGSHRLNVRVDGGTWSVPPGVPTVADEFGGAAGLLIVR
jgi:hypothetical protein